MIPLINETYKAMLTGKSVIRELNEYANDTKQHPHLKMEDIFDDAQPGNPSWCPCRKLLQRAYP